MMPKRCEPTGGVLRAGILFLGVVLFAGCATAPATRVSLAGLPPEQAQRAAHYLPVFNAAWDLVNRKHYDPKY